MLALALTCALVAVPDDTAPPAPVPPPAVATPAAPDTAAPAPASAAVAPPPPPPPTTTSGRVKVIVLDLKGAALTANERAALTSLVTVALSEFPALEVVSGADVRALLDLEGEKQAVGCDENMSCLAEMAGALGARLVTFGSVERLGSLHVLSLNLQDTKASASVGRVALRGDSLDAIAEALPASVHKMALPFLYAERLATTTTMARDDAPATLGKGALAWSGGIAALAGAALFAATYIGGIAVAAGAGAESEEVELLKVPVVGKLQLAADPNAAGGAADASQAPGYWATGALEGIGATAAVGGALAFGAARVVDGPELDAAGNAFRWGLIGGGAAFAIGGVAFDATAPSSNNSKFDIEDLFAPSLEAVGITAAIVGVVVTPFTGARAEELGAEP